jgi:hypothetical protein
VTSLIEVVVFAIEVGDFAIEVNDHVVEVDVLTHAVANQRGEVAQRLRGGAEIGDGVE